MTGPTGNSKFCFPSNPQRSPRLRLGDIEGLGETKTHCFSWGQSLGAYCYLYKGMAFGLYMMLLKPFGMTCNIVYLLFSNFVFVLIIKEV